MTKNEIIKQEYKNLLEAIYNKVKSDENIINLFKNGKEIVNDYINSVYKKYVTERGNFGASAERFYEEFGRNGEMPATPLNEYETKVFNYYKDDFDIDDRVSTEGREGLIKEVTNFAQKVYKTNPKNKYAQVIAGSLSNIKEIKIENDFEELYSQFPNKTNISEFIKKYENIKNLYNLDLGLNKYTTEQLKTLVRIINLRISDEKNIITANTPKPNFSREYNNGEGYWDDNTPTITEYQKETITKANEKIEKYNALKEKITNKLKKSKQSTVEK